MNTDKIQQEFINKFETSTSSKTYRRFTHHVRGFDMILFNMLEEVQLNYIFNSIKTTKEDIVLDVGCGVGDILQYIVEKYNCKGFGIDLLPEKLINPIRKFSYIQRDVEAIDDIKIAPTITLFIDSSYFINNIQKVIKHLNNTLNSKMYLFHSEYGFDKLDCETLKADKTKVGKVLSTLGVRYRTIDLTQNEIDLYISIDQNLESYREDFIIEGNLQLYEILENENRLGMKFVEDKSIGRYLYIIE